jgi:hypothetical protein
VVDAPQGPRIERQRNKVSVLMLASQRLAVTVLPSEFRAAAELLIISDPAQQSSPQQSHSWERPFHERQNIPLLVG